METSMSFFDELKRRNVFRVGIAYLITSWLLIQVTDILFESIGVPPWVMQAMFVVIAAGFVIALILAWAFEMTPEGVKRESQVDRSQSITTQTGRKLDFLIIAVLVSALGYFVWESRFQKTGAVPEPAETVAVEQLSSTRPDAGVPTKTTITPESTRKSIVVLPFINMSNDPEQEFFSDGLSEELLNVLAQIKDLRVISRTSAFAFKGKDVSIPDIAAKLNVSHVLEGSVRRAGNDVRITAQLIEVATDSHLWSDAYNRKLENVFEIQEEISKAIAQELQVTLGTGSAGPAAKPTENLKAYQLFLRGRHLYQNRGPGVVRAIELLQQAVELDPSFANAWANLAAAAAVRAFSVDEGFQDLNILAEQSAQKAIELDPNNGLAHAVIGLRMSASLRWEQAIEELGVAIKLNPSESNSLLWMGITLSELGYTRQAIEFLKQAEFVDPVFTNLQNWFSILYFQTGQVEQARMHQQKAQELDPGFELNDVGSYELIKGDIDTAEKIALASLTEETEGNKVIIQAVFAALRDPSKTDWAVSTVLANKDQASWYGVFSQLYRLGAIEESIENWHEIRTNGRGLRAANTLSSIWHAYDRTQLSNPALVRLFNDSGLAEYWRKNGNPDYCRVDGDKIECGVQ
jgi:TolB-like protein/Flp pilus assembly protein TadD